MAAIVNSQWLSNGENHDNHCRSGWECSESQTSEESEVNPHPSLSDPEGCITMTPGQPGRRETTNGNSKPRRDHRQEEIERNEKLHSENVKLLKGKNKLKEKKKNLKKVVEAIKHCPGCPQFKHRLRQRSSVQNGLVCPDNVQPFVQQTAPTVAQTPLSAPSSGDNIQCEPSGLKRLHPSTSLPNGMLDPESNRAPILSNLSRANSYPQRSCSTSNIIDNNSTRCHDTCANDHNLQNGYGGQRQRTMSVNNAITHTGHDLHPQQDAVMTNGHSHSHHPPCHNPYMTTHSAPCHSQNGQSGAGTCQPMANDQTRDSQSANRSHGICCQCSGAQHTNVHTCSHNLPHNLPWNSPYTFRNNISPYVPTHTCPNTCYLCALAQLHQTAQLQNGLIQTLMHHENPTHHIQTSPVQSHPPHTEVKEETVSVYKTLQRDVAPIPGTSVRLSQQENDVILANADQQNGLGTPVMTTGQSQVTNMDVTPGPRVITVNHGGSLVEPSASYPLPALGNADGRNHHSVVGFSPKSVTIGVMGAIPSGTITVPSHHGEDVSAISVSQASRPSSVERFLNGEDTGDEFQLQHYVLQNQNQAPQNMEQTTHMQGLGASHIQIQNSSPTILNGYIPGVSTTTSNMPASNSVTSAIPPPADQPTSQPPTAGNPTSSNVPHRGHRFGRRRSRDSHFELQSARVCVKKPQPDTANSSNAEPDQPPTPGDRKSSPAAPTEKLSQAMQGLNLADKETPKDDPKACSDPVSTTSNLMESLTLSEKEPEMTDSKNCPDSVSTDESVRVQTTTLADKETEKTEPRL